MAGPDNFDVVQLRQGALKGAQLSDVAAFWRKYEDVVRSVSALNLTLSRSISKVDAMKLALANSTAKSGQLDHRLHELQSELMSLDVNLNGNRSKRGPGEKRNPTIGSYLSSV